MNNITPFEAYYFCRDVIKGRSEELEKIIMKDPEYSTRYCRHILKSRWIEAEEYILKSESPKKCYWYAYFVIQGPWPEAEKYIAKDVWANFFYYADIVKPQSKK